MVLASTEAGILKIGADDGSFLFHHGEANGVLADEYTFEYRVRAVEGECDAQCGGAVLALTLHDRRLGVLLDTSGVLSLDTAAGRNSIATLAKSPHTIQVVARRMGQVVVLVDDTVLTLLAWSELGEADSSGVGQNLDTEVSFGAVRATVEVDEVQQTICRRSGVVDIAIQPGFAELAGAVPGSNKELLQGLQELRFDVSGVEVTYRGDPTDPSTEYAVSEEYGGQSVVLLSGLQNPPRFLGRTSNPGGFIVSVRVYLHNGRIQLRDSSANALVNGEHSGAIELKSPYGPLTTEAHENMRLVWLFRPQYTLRLLADGTFDLAGSDYMLALPRDCAEEGGSYACGNLHCGLGEAGEVKCTEEPSSCELRTPEVEYVTVANWNVLQDYRLHQRDNCVGEPDADWESRVDRFAAWVAGLGAPVDAIVMSEVRNTRLRFGVFQVLAPDTQLEYIRRRLESETGARYLRAYVINEHYASEFLVDGVWSSVVVLYRPDRLRLVPFSTADTGTYGPYTVGLRGPVGEVPHEVGLWANYYVSARSGRSLALNLADSLEPPRTNRKKVALSRFEVGGCTKRYLNLFNTHFPLGDDNQVSAVSDTLEYIDAIQSTLDAAGTYPPLLVGDLNLKDGDTAYSGLVSRLDDLYDVKAVEKFLGGYSGANRSFPSVGALTVEDVQELAACVASDHAVHVGTFRLSP